ncbi:hypothetical protein QR685DRAFT_600664 [Neurospora intermedia]|uniref:Uncharacterized protein n=1 Tax=Neurospora intermedia TaxID=5142 RepID=A0ABR3D0U2_NEUIN
MCAVRDSNSGPFTAGCSSGQPYGSLLNLLGLHFFIQNSRHLLVLFPFSSFNTSPYLPSPHPQHNATYTQVVKPASTYCPITRHGEGAAAATSVTPECCLLFMSSVQKLGHANARPLGHPATSDLRCFSQERRPELSLQLFLVKGSKLYSFQSQDPILVRSTQKGFSTLWPATAPADFYELFIDPMKTLLESMLLALDQ